MKKQLYLDIASEANSSLRNRKKVAIGRGGIDKIPRRYHLLPEDLIQIKRQMQEENKFISPYGPGRIYTYIIEALVSLGIGKPHPVSLVYNKFQELASDENTKDKKGKTLWERFSTKPPRNLKTSRDPLAKFLQNIEVLQRLGGDHPYAFKLAQVGACIDIYLDSTRQIKVQLRTGISIGDEVKPVNTNRKRNYTKTVDSVISGIVIPVDASEETVFSQDETDIENQDAEV